MSTHVIINDLKDKGVSLLGALSPNAYIEADNDQIYDVRISFDRIRPNAPHLICLSHDKDAGYFIDIDDVTWEFGDDEIRFTEDAIMCLKAIADGRVSKNSKKLFGLIKLKEELLFNGSSEHKA